MEPPRPTSSDGRVDRELRDHWNASEDMARESTTALAARKHPLLGSRLVDSRSLKVIRPASFSLGTIVSGITTLVGYRDLLYTMTLFRIAVRYKQSVLGWVWAALQPLAMMLIYTLVFSRVARVPNDGVPYSLFVFSGLLPWTFFSSAVSNAINGLVAYSDLLTKLHFPREIIPLSYVFTALVDFAIACGVLSGLMVYYRLSFSWKVLYAFPVVAVLVAFTSAVALILSSVQVRFRDVGAALPVVLQIGVFATPVIYPLNWVPSRYQRLYLMNPVACVIENFRRIVLRGSAPDVPMLITSAAITLCCLVLSYAYFKATEATMSDTI